MTLTEVMLKIAEKQKEAQAKQAEIAEINKEIRELQKEHFGIDGENLGLVEMVGLVQKITLDTLTENHSKEKSVN